jgi:16S rRNA processing protein RimM
MELFRIGRVSGTHHLKGTVKVTSTFDDIDVLEGNKVVLNLKNGEKKIFTVEEARRINEKIILVDFSEITNKSDASTLNGAEINIRRDLLGEISEDSFYNSDIIGMEVINLDGSILGLVEDVLETGAHDILVVNEGSDEVMIPAVELYVLDIDFDSRKIKVDVPEELININK